MTRSYDGRAKVAIDKRWVMRCDQDGCETASEPSARQPELWQFAAQGWFIAKEFGDVCPPCLTSGVKPTAQPHRVRQAVLS